MVAMMPSRKSFLMISAAGLPIFSDSSFTVMVSEVMTAWSMTTGAGFTTSCLLFLPLRRLPMVPYSSHTTEGPFSFCMAFLFFAFLSLS